MIHKNLVISFSGGETSAYMTWWLKRNIAKYCKKFVIVFANTGQEHEKTLEFVKNCDDRFGFKTRWIEADVKFGSRARTGFKITDFENASRDGQPFEDVIKKYGIPNSAFKGCTKDLKTNPITAYGDHVFGKNNYATVIGIRVDEVDRINYDSKRKLFYPLAKEHPMTKQDINEWWRSQNFRLDIPHYQGNCTWCWKKSTAKLLSVMHETPEAFDFPERMQETYSMSGPEFDIERTRRMTVADPSEARRFFRGNKTVQDLRDEYQKRIENGTFKLSDDLAQDYGDEGGCGESCEAFAD